MKKCLGIIGCGQLGQMLARAARKLGAEVVFLQVNETPVVHGVGKVYEVTELEDFLNQVDFVTVEREAIPEEILKTVARRVPLSPSYDALIRLRSRHSQKALFDELEIPTAPWCLVNSSQDMASALQKFPVSHIRAKRVLGGYDGGGQWSLDKNSLEQKIPDDAFPVILEAEVEIDSEVSVLIARTRTGKTLTYPLSQNIMRDGILTWSFVPAGIDVAMANEIRHYAEKLVQGIDYVGVLAMEFFISKGKLVVNEIAPRVHNTGHWTIDGCECDQFEQHARAVLDLPLRDPAPTGAAAMCNILGDMMPMRLPDEPVRMYLHSYGKTLRSGRKMGHITLIGPELQGVQKAASAITVEG